MAKNKLIVFLTLGILAIGIGISVFLILSTSKSDWKEIVGPGYVFKIPPDWEVKQPNSYKLHVFGTPFGEVEMWLASNENDLSAKAWLESESVRSRNKDSYSVSDHSRYAISENVKESQPPVYATKVGDKYILLATCTKDCDKNRFMDIFGSVLKTLTLE